MKEMIRTYWLPTLIVTAGLIILGWSMWAVSVDPGCCCR